MVSYEGEKMSKSLGNLVFVSDLLKVADPRAIRLALMRHHYRAGFEWYDTDLDEGTALLHRLVAAAEVPIPAPTPRPSRQRVRDAIDDDLDAPEALEALDDLASAILSGRRRPDRAGGAARARRARRRRRSTDSASCHGAESGRRRREPRWYRRSGHGRSRSRSRCPTVRRARSPKGATPAEVAASIGKRLGKDALGGQGRRRVGRSRPHRSSTTRTSRSSSPRHADGREVLRHSTAHVLAQAVTDLFPGARYAIGPAIDDGFYYDFELPDGAHFTDDDLERIEARMREIVADDQPFVRDEVGPRRRDSRSSPTSPTSSDIIEKVDASEVGDGTVVALYRNPRADGRTFVDLCRGPHVPTTGAARRVQAHEGRRRVLARRRARARSSSGSTARRGSRKEALEEHLHRLEEAERRDHRRLGAELDLFSFPDEIGSGLAVFHPKGALVRKLMEDYSRERHEAGGYSFVNSPHITKSNLFETSGHLDWFADGMFPPMELDEGRRGPRYYLKPMNCPFHILIFRSRMRSYRELPLRMFEFGTVYRYERSGVVHGLTRVRGMTQDDAHIFCTKEQMADELRSLLVFVLDLLARLRARTTSTSSCRRSPRARPSARDEEWDEATEALRAAARGDGPRARPRRGWRRVLRPEDLRAGARRDRSDVAGVDDPGRLPDAAALRPGVRRRRQRAPPADHDPPRAVRLDRAVLRDPARALRRRVPDVARARPGDGAAGRRPSRRVRAPPRRPAHAPRATASSCTMRTTTRSVRGSGGPRSRRCPYVLVVGDDDVESGTVGVNRRASDAPGARRRRRRASSSGSRPSVAEPERG